VILSFQVQGFKVFRLSTVMEEAHAQQIIEGRKKMEEES
jgi:hypothetical protein